MATKFINRKGESITSKEWNKLRGDPAYTTIRLYDNGVVNVELKWVGRIENHDQVLPDYYKMYVLLVKNYRENGTLVNDPVDNDQYFAKEDLAIDAYEKFLMKWTDCGLNEDLEWFEPDNRAEKPKPIKPDEPPPPRSQVSWMQMSALGK